MFFVLTLFTVVWTKFSGVKMIAELEDKWKIAREKKIYYCWTGKSVTKLPWLFWGHFCHRIPSSTVSAFTIEPWTFAFYKTDSIKKSPFVQSLWYSSTARALDHHQSCSAGSFHVSWKRISSCFLFHSLSKLYKAKREQMGGDGRKLILILGRFPMICLLFYVNNSLLKCFFSFVWIPRLFGLQVFRFLNSGIYP